MGAPGGGGTSKCKDPGEGGAGMILWKWVCFHSSYQALPSRDGGGGRQVEITGQAPVSTSPHPQAWGHTSLLALLMGYCVPSNSYVQVINPYYFKMWLYLEICSLKM